jgi:hypothetical protein
MGIGSFYEGDDPEDVSLPPISPDSLLEGARLPDLTPLLIVVGCLPPTATAAAAIATLLAFQFRSPPIP